MIADCGLKVTDYGLRIGDCGLYYYNLFLTVLIDATVMERISLASFFMLVSSLISEII